MPRRLSYAATPRLPRAAGYASAAFVAAGVTTLPLRRYHVTITMRRRHDAAALRLFD